MRGGRNGVLCVLCEPSATSAVRRFRGISVIGGFGSLFGRINSLFGRLGNLLDHCRNNNDLHTGSAPPAGRKRVFPGIFPLIRDVEGRPSGSPPCRRPASRAARSRPSPRGSWQRPENLLVPSPAPGRGAIRRGRGGRDWPGRRPRAPDRRRVLTSPPAIAVIVGGRPLTGASSISTPRARQASAIRRATAGAFVVMSI